MEEIIKYKIKYKSDYFKDIEKHQKAGQKNSLKKIADFLIEMQEHPTTGTGQVEQLKGYEERSVWSRRINQKHRLVYEIFEDEKSIDIISAYGHYDDK